MLTTTSTKISFTNQPSINENHKSKKRLSFVVLFLVGLIITGVIAFQAFQNQGKYQNIEDKFNQNIEVNNALIQNLNEQKLDLSEAIKHPNQPEFDYILASLGLAKFDTSSEYIQKLQDIDTSLQSILEPAKDSQTKLEVYEEDKILSQKQLDLQNQRLEILQELSDLYQIASCIIDQKVAFENNLDQLNLDLGVELDIDNPASQQNIEYLNTTQILYNTTQNYFENHIKCWLGGLTEDEQPELDKIKTQLENLSLASNQSFDSSSQDIADFQDLIQTQNSDTELQELNTRLAALDPISTLIDSNYQELQKEILTSKLQRIQTKLDQDSSDTQEINELSQELGKEFNLDIKSTLSLN